MSLGIVVKGSEGIVLAADSRVTLTAQIPQQADNTILHLPVNFDNATKLLTFNDHNQWVGAVTYGDAVIGTTPSDLRTAQSFVSEFELSILDDGRLSVQEFSQRLSNFFLDQWNTRMPQGHQTDGMIFVVAGFDEGAAYGSVYEFNIPNQPNPAEQGANDFGITFGGQNELAARIIHGYDLRCLGIIQQTLGLDPAQVTALQQALGQLQLSIPYHLLPLQDCIDLAIFLIQMTTTAQNLSIGIRGVGGAIDVAVITTREGLKIIQQKDLVGEIFN